jgi:hypothetical protein
MARGVFRDGGVVVGGKLEELKNFGMVFVRTRGRIYSRPRIYPPRKM